MSGNIWTDTDPEDVGEMFDEDDATEMKNGFKCNVLNCGGGECVHKPINEVCPLCGYQMIEVKTTGIKFCSNPNTEYQCDYEC